MKDFDVPPLKRQKLSNERLEQRLENVLVEASCNIAQKAKKIFEINVPAIKETVSENIFEDSRALRSIIISLQARFASTKSVREKIKLLLLLSANWQYLKIKKYFNCTYNMFRQLNMFRDDGYLLNK